MTDILNSKSELSAKDFVCHFADLPSNDFNTLFKQLAGEGGGERERTWFAEGVPGSQYSRMFPHSSLHVAMTTLTLHYLSEVNLVSQLNGYLLLKMRDDQDFCSARFQFPSIQNSSIFSRWSWFLRCALALFQ